MRKKQIWIIAAILLVVGPLFHNCGQMQSKTEVLNSLACENDMLPVFENTYHSFFNEQKCTRCHAPNTVAGTPKFADPDSLAALKVFMMVEPDRIESKLKTGHQGYAYTNLEKDLLSHKDSWNTALLNSSCTGSAFVSSSKSILFFDPLEGADDVNILKPELRDEWVTLTWSLDDGRLPAGEGVEFSMDIKVQYNSTFFTPQSYLVNNLRVKSTKHNLRIEGIYILLNGKTYSVSTFKELNADVSRSSSFLPLTDSLSAAIFDKPEGEKYENADRWSVKIEVIEK